LKEIHANLRIQCFKHNLTMQDVFEELSERIAAEDTDMVEMLQDLSMKRKDKKLQKFSDLDKTSIFSMIEDENPLLEK